MPNNNVLFLVLWFVTQTNHRRRMSPQGVDHRRDGSREAEVLCCGRTVMEIHGRRTGQANDRSGTWLEA